MAHLIWSHEAELSPSQCPVYFPDPAKVDLEMRKLLFPGNTVSMALERNESGIRQRKRQLGY